MEWSKLINDFWWVPIGTISGALLIWGDKTWKFLGNLPSIFKRKGGDPVSAALQSELRKCSLSDCDRIAHIQRTHQVWSKTDA